jgi:hypothetical protein
LKLWGFNLEPYSSESPRNVSSPISTVWPGPYGTRGSFKVEDVRATAVKVSTTVDTSVTIVG